MRNEVCDFVEVLRMPDLALVEEGRNCRSLLKLQWVFAGRWKCRKELNGTMVIPLSCLMWKTFLVRRA